MAQSSYGHVRELQVIGSSPGKDESESVSFLPQATAGLIGNTSGAIGAGAVSPHMSPHMYDY